MQKKTNIAIVGCGVIANTHLRALKKMQNSEVVAVCDLDEKKAIDVAKNWKIRNYYTDFHKLLSNEDISILSILTPPSSHPYLAIEAIKNGINVLIEKPFTLTTIEAESVIKSLKKSTAKMTVVYHWLYGNAMLRSLSLIRSHKIGEILHANIKVVHNAKEDPMASDPDHWCHRLFGGRFGEMLPHPVYVLQSIMGDNLRITKTIVSKRGDIPWLPDDELYSTLEGDNISGSLYVSLNAPRQLITVEVFGTKKILKIDLTRQMLLQLESTPISNFSIGKDTLSEAFRLLLMTGRNTLKYSFRQRGDVSIAYNMFINSIEKGLDPLVTPEMAHDTVRIVEEICKNCHKPERVQ